MSGLLSLTERLLNRTPVSGDPVQSCCGLALTDCECNQIVCSRCQLTKAEVELLSEPCVTFNEVIGGAEPIKHLGHLWVTKADESKPSATASVPHRIICDNMTCGFCRRMLWDCRCPADVECACCELSPEDADVVGADCEESPDGIHRWKTDGESV